jgi:hypothetical protein
MGYSKLTYEQYVEHPDVWGVELPKWAKELSAKGYTGVSAIDFYDDVFGEDLEEECLPEDYKTGEYAGIAVEKVKKLDANGEPVLDADGKCMYIGRRYTVTRGNSELYDLIDRSDNFCMIAPISYAGRTRKNENARYMYALCIEVDHIEPRGGLNELIYSWERKVLPVPKPTYIVCSGNGLHLYYVFERPIPLWKNIFEQLTEVKKYFTPRLWTKYITSAYESIQYESINQPFRCVGSRTKDDSYAMAFDCGEKITIEYLNKFLPEDKRLDCVYKSTCTLEQAKELYPEWYRRRIEQGDKSKKHWNRYQPIYYNWIDKILQGAVVGRRYHCLENLCSLAVQCNISPEQVEKDCRMVAEHFELLTTDDNNHFTEYDILCALKTYYTASEQAYTRKIEYISKKTGINLIPNKRNGRPQILHLKGARAIQKINDEAKGTNWREGNGRPKGSDRKMEVVAEYMTAHPECSNISQIARECKVSRPTVYKYLDPQKYAEKYLKSKNKPTSGNDVVQKSTDIEVSVSRLPAAFVVEGDPNMTAKMLEYAAQGVRQVEILTKQEYDELMADELMDMFLSDREKNNE